MANRKSTPENPTQRDIILDFVRANPKCTTTDIRAALRMDLPRVGMYLTRLRLTGYVENEKKKGVRLAKWSAVPEEDQGALKIKRIVRSEWKPEHARDPLHVAFFGPAQVAA